MTLVSVIIPTRNSGQTIERCLRSVGAQSYPDVEIIVVDNHSDDGTAEIAAKYARVLSGGPERCAQVNMGAAHAKGDYLYRIDGDFELDTGVIAACVAKIEQEGLDVIAVPNRSAGEGYWERVRALERDTYRDDPLIVAARFWRREAFEAVGGLDESLVACEDYDLHNRLLAAGYRLGRIDPGEVHLGEPGSLWAHAVKHFYYGPSVWRYLGKHPQRGARQMFPLRPAFFRHWRTLLSQPFLLVGLIILKVVQYGSAAAGILLHGLGTADEGGREVVNTLASLILVLASLVALVEGISRFASQPTGLGIVIIFLTGLMLWQVVSGRRAAINGRPKQSELLVVALAFTPFILVWALESVLSTTVWPYSFALAVSLTIALLIVLAEPSEWTGKRILPLLVTLASGFFVVLFTLRGVTLVNAFFWSGTDLAVFDQSLWTTANGPGDLPLLSSSLAGSSLFLQAPAPMLLLLVPFYKVGIGGPALLIFLQATAIALGAIAIYRLASDQTGRLGAVLLAIAYLFYFLTLRSAAAAIRVEVLAIPLLLFALDAYLRGRYWLFYLLVAATLLCGIDAALAVAGLGLLLLSKWHDRRHGVLTLILGLSSVVVLIAVFIPFFGGSTGAPFSPYVPPAGVTWIEHLWISLTRPDALRYLVALLAPLAFTPLLAPLLLLPALPRLLLNLMGDGPLYLALSGRFAYTIVPFLFLASAYGLGWLGRGRVSFKLAGSALVLSTVLLTNFIVNPGLVDSLFRQPLPPAPVRGEEVLALLPDETSLATQSSLATRLAQRQTLHLLPRVEDVEYVLFDVFQPIKTLDPGLYEETILRAYNNPEYGLKAADQGYLLFQQGLDPAGNRERLALAHEDEIDHPLEIPLDDRVLYRGFSLSVEALEPGMPAVLTHYWQSLAPVDKPYLIFTAYPGRYLFEQAAFGLYPVGEWQTGDLVRHELVIQLPPLPPGTAYEIVTGLWYDKGQPALSGPEQLLGNDVIRVASIILEDDHYRIVPRLTD